MAERRQTGQQATRRQADSISAPLERASKVLDLVAGAPHGLRASEIAERLALPQPTAYRLVRRLEKIGYLQLNGRGLEYSIGPQLKALARAIQADRPLELVLQSVIQNLADVTRMTAYLAARAGTQIVLVVTRTPAAAEGPSIVPGNRFPAHATAAGRVILSTQSPEVVEEFLAHADFERFTPRTIGSAKRLLAELAKAKAAGHAISKGELGNGLWALAVPVPVAGPSDYAVGVLTFQDQVKTSAEAVAKLARTVAATARDLSGLLAGPAQRSPAPKPREAG